VETLYQSLVCVHITGGFGGLLLLWVPLLTRKGGRTHRRVGWAYVTCMSVAVATAFVMVAILLVDPLAAKPLRRPHPPEEIAVIMKQYRAFAAFLGMLALLTFVSGWTGLTVLRHKKDPLGMRTPFNLGSSALLGLVGVVVLVMGLQQGIWLLVFLGPLGILTGFAGTYALLYPPRLNMGWWYDHLGGMMGTGIAAYTAFTVFGAQRWMPDLARTALFPLFWIVPIVGGVIASEWMTRHYKRKFGDLPGGRPSAEDSGRVSTPSA